MTVLSPEEAMQHLNMTSDVNTDELWGVIDAAEALLAARVGPLEPTTVTCTVHSAGPALVLPITPVISLTSVTSVYDAVPVDVSGLTLNASAGVVTGSTYGAGFTATAGAYTVVYEAGRAEGELPGDLLFAIKEMVRHLWKSQRGGSTRPGSPDQGAAPGYLIPNAVAELIEPHRQLSVA